MLTEREQAIKDRLLEEMGSRSCAETRRTGAPLGPTGLEEGVRRIRSQQRWRLWMGLACFAYVAAVTVVMGLKVGRWTPPVLVLMGVVWLVAYFQQYEWFRRRLLVYRILGLLAEDDGEKAEAGPRTDRETT